MLAAHLFYVPLQYAAALFNLALRFHRRATPDKMPAERVAWALIEAIIHFLG